jgi:hypothetical protein
MRLRRPALRPDLDAACFVTACEDARGGTRSAATLSHPISCRRVEEEIRARRIRRDRHVPALLAYPNAPRETSGSGLEILARRFRRPARPSRLQPARCDLFRLNGSAPAPTESLAACLAGLFDEAVRACLPGAV